MPLLKLETTVTPSEQQRQELLTSLSRIVAQSIGKPEQYVMVTFSPAAILMSGQPGEAALVEVRSIGGLSGTVNRKISAEVCKLLSDVLRITSERVYLNFTSLEAGSWGWNGSTFG